MARSFSLSGCLLALVWMTGGCDVWIPAGDLEDYDGDGAPAEGAAGVADCDDFDAAIHPGADEICDGVDNNCNGLVDSEDGTLGEGSLFFRDRDEDGLGWEEDTLSACEIPSGYVESAGDCSDDDFEVGEASTWYPDEDKDGFGDEEAEGEVACVQAQEGWVTNGSDCDDTDPQINPGVTEYDCEDENPQDFNCDGLVGSIDSDGDGYPACEDCDDTNVDISPDGVEVCDGLDNDCSGEPDDNAPEGALAYFPDRDGDGLANLDEMWMICDHLQDWIRSSEEDCDDSSADVGGPTSWYRDQDGDLFGDVDDEGVQSCEQPFSHVSNHGDCDDSDASVNPGVVEDCSSQFDLNCDGEVGDTDADGDGFSACEDCNDANAAIHPDAEEICDGKDNDCQGGPDGSDAIDRVEWFIDADDDGYGDSDHSVFSCDMPEGYMANDFDCDDEVASVHPNAKEVCDGLNNACSTLPVDEIDNDGDGHVECVIDEEGWDGHEEVVGGSDCNDADAEVSPLAQEECNGIDDDCDGEVDEEVISAGIAWYEDADGDGFGDEDGFPLEACLQPSGFVEDNTDCDDSDAAVSPFDSDGDGERDFCRWKDVDAGDGFSCALDDDGDIHCWGDEAGCGMISSVPTGGPYVEISAGSQYACAIRFDGASECWGCDAAATWIDPPGGTALSQIDVGPNLLACGVDEFLDVHCWGDSTVWALPMTFEGLFLTQVALYNGKFCFLQQGGALVCLDEFGQFDPEVPLGIFTLIEGQFLHACALAEDRSLACWGDNGSQQASPPSGSFSTVGTGLFHSCAIDTGIGAADCWGCLGADFGQCTPPASTFEVLGVGFNHNCAIDSTGLLQCWGANENGESTPP